MKYNVLFLIQFSLLTSLLGCSLEMKPGQVYQEYNSKVIDGMTFEEEKKYYSKRKQAEIEAKFPTYMKQMNKSRKEVIDFYLDFTSKHAKCKKLQLMTEIIKGDTAELVFLQTDICGNNSNTEEKQIINMVYENGWKIDEIEIDL